MKQVINIVIDIETLSLQSDAAIVSIAAVPFNPYGQIPKGDEPVEFGVFDVYCRDKECGTCIITDQGYFYEVVNTTSCAFYGMSFEEETIKWWEKQSEEVKADLLNRAPMNIGNAINALHNYLEGIKNAYDADIKVWAQGSDFDFPILKNAYRKTMKDTKLPWSYKMQRDARTYILEKLEKYYGVEERPYDRIPPMPENMKWLAHSALSDARRTAWCLAYVNGLCRSISEAHTSAITPKSSE